MMTQLTCDVIAALKGKTLSVAESCTGGMIAAALTEVPGSSAVFMGGVVSYVNRVKIDVLGVSPETLEREGAVSAAVAEAMALGVRRITNSDYSLSVTGLAGPGGDEYGNPIGTVYIGYADACGVTAVPYLFAGNREEIRTFAVRAALELLLKQIM